jgi:hypothetical protein
MDIEGDGSGLFEDSIPAFVKRLRGNYEKPQLQ